MKLVPSNPLCVDSDALKHARLKTRREGSPFSASADTQPFSLSRCFLTYNSLDELNNNMVDTMLQRKAVLVGGIQVDTSSFDLSDHSSNVASVKTANTILIAVVGLIICLRLFVRIYMVRKVFLDDVLIVLAAAFTITLGVVCLVATHHGLGTHVWLFPISAVFETVKRTIQYLYICQVLYACAIASTKLAIIASYLRFIQNQRFRLYMYGTSVIILGLWITGVFVTIFQCRPVEGAWDFTIESRKCIDYVDYLYASSSVNVATDIILCVLPCPYLWKLHMPRKQRVILCILFAGGAGACVAGIVRIAYLHTLRSMDVTFQSVPCLNLSVIECSLGIICVSVPPLRPLFARLLPKGMLTTRASSSSKSPLQSLSTTKKPAVQICATSNQEVDADPQLIEDNSSAEYDAYGQRLNALAVPPLVKEVSTLDSDSRQKLV